uniref:RRM domain-containing protein n=1 Tax=Globodera rostochiensis TaxID=31243 RepID=A0A914I360_GLORO
MVLLPICRVGTFVPETVAPTKRRHRYDRRSPKPFQSTIDLSRPSLISDHLLLPRLAISSRRPARESIEHTSITSSTVLLALLSFIIHIDGGLSKATTTSGTLILLKLINSFRIRKKQTPFTLSSVRPSVRPQYITSSPPTHLISILSSATFVFRSLIVQQMMFFQLASAMSTMDDGHQYLQQHYGPPISPLFGSSGSTGASASMNLAGKSLTAPSVIYHINWQLVLIHQLYIQNSIMISPLYQPLGHLAPALFMPSIFGSGSFMQSLLSAAVSAVPTQHRKLFIGGLNHETTDEQLSDYYSQWGQVVDCIVIRDPVTRQSRGFGFVTYASTEMADAAMADRPHTIAGKVVDPKRAIPREQMLQATNCPPAFLDVLPPSDCKLCLSGITNHTVDILRHYFERFGELEQACVDKCLAHGKYHVINGRKVEVRQGEQVKPKVSIDEMKTL